VAADRLIHVTEGAGITRTQQFQASEANQ